MLKYVQNSNGQFTYSDIMKDDFDIKQLDNNEVYVYYITGHSYFREEVKNKVFLNLGDELKKTGNDYFKRCEIIMQREGEAIRKSIEKNKKEISLLRSYKLSTLIEIYSSEKMFSEEIRNNKLLVFLLRHGYIDESYADYINYFHPKSITKDEMNFILGIRNYEAIGDFTYPLKNFGSILERIEEREFRQPEALNFNLFDYMILQKEKSRKYDVMIQQIVNRSAKSKEFIKAYLEREVNTEIFIQELCRKSEYIWFDIVTDNSIFEGIKYKYLNLILCNVDIFDIKRNDYNVEHEIQGGICKFIASHDDILQWLDVPVETMKQIIKTLNICFKRLKIRGVDKEILEYIYDNQYFELNLIMLGNLFDLKKPESIPDLYMANYKTVRSLGYDPLIKKIHTEFAEYVQTFILDMKTNVEEDIESVEDIIERLYSIDLKMCLHVIEKEPVIWEKIENCCAVGLQNEEERKIVSVIWNQILKENRTIPSWDNYSKYRDEFGVTDELIEYVDTHIDDFINAPDSFIVNDNIIKEILVEKISLRSFVKFIKKYKLEKFTNKFNDFDVYKMTAMIDERYFPFSAEQFIELRQTHPDMCINFICNNTEDFMGSIDECGLKRDEIVELLRNNSFSDDERIKILNQVGSMEIDERMAFEIRRFKFRINKEYVEAAWNQLSGEDRYELLINQIKVYSMEELAVKFNELGGVYQQLAKRTRHKVSFHDDSAGYNRRLLNYLNEIGYLSSVKEEYVDVVVEEGNLHNKKAEHRITGMVKQAS